MKGFIVYRSYEEIQEKGYIVLYGRQENGKSFATMNEFYPYFFIQEEDKKIIDKIDPNKEVLIEKTKLSTFQDKRVIKLIFKNQKHLLEFAKEINEFKIPTYEQDLKPTTRFIIDNEIKDYIEIEGDSENKEKIGIFYLNPKITACTGTAKLKIASIDIESSKDSKKLFCIGVYSENDKKVFMITKNKIPGVTDCKNERDCLEMFKEYINELDPDIITGWNVINFDFEYLKRLFKENNILFDIGRNNKEPRIKLEKDFLKKSTMDIPGRLVLDGLNLIRDPFIKEAPSIKNIRFESYTLERVAQQILKESKLITGKQRHEEIEKLYRGNSKEQQKLAEYNLQDCKLVYDILKKTKIIELSMERASLTGMQLDRLTASIASFDSLYIRKARKRNLVSGSNFFKNKSEKIKGGFVMTPKPGIYHNVLVLDFKSLYPSIIKTFNIDPASFIEKSEKGCITSPNKAYFKNQEGILPEIIEELHQAREKAKLEKRELSSYAIKIIMNSFFGVLASPNSRYFDLKIGNAITNFGQEIIKLTSKKIKEEKLEVIYGDTDSIFISTGLSKEKAELLGRGLPIEINKFYEKYVKKDFNRKSFLELEFDKLYLSLIIPRTRDIENDAGAKKRYAGLIEKNGEEILNIVGLEAIRGDWTEAAQDFQKELLMKVFKKEDIIKFIRDFIESVKKGELDKKLIYRKSIRKELKEYTKTTPPHVKAARKLDSLDGNIIEYYITLEGPEPLQKLKNKLDYDHYIEKQIQPIAKTILETLEIEPERVFSKTRQEKLF